MTKLFACTLILSIQISISLATSAQEWVRFRGPNGTGVSDAQNLPTKWTEADYRWRTKLPGIGHSSPVIWGDRIFVTSSDEKSGTRFVLCLDSESGQIVWEKKYPFDIHRRHRFNSFASATPTVDAEHVYVVWSTPEEYALIALDHDGSEVWRKNLGPFVSQHSCGTSPIVHNGLVILGNDQDLKNEIEPEVAGESFLIAVHAATGETAWKVPRDSAVVAYSTPCFYQSEDGATELIFNSQAHGITSLNPQTGKLNWEVRGVFERRSCSSPVVAGGLIFGSCGSGGGGNYVVGVSPGSQKSKGSVKYKMNRSAPYVPTPIAMGDRIFLWSDGGVVTNLQASSGKTIWQGRVSGTFFGSPVLIGDKIYCMSAGGDIVIIRASDTFELIATNSLGEPSHSTPAVAEGTLYLRTVSHLIAIGPKKK